MSEEMADREQMKTTAYIPGEKNGKWSEEQHMKYIAFIDFYREKMRSKEKRRYLWPYLGQISSTKKCPTSL